MARASVAPKILGLLEPFLESAERDWLDKPAANRTPTLPLTNDGKVNVAKLVEALNLPPSYQQHFFKPAIATVVNVVAAVQGVKPIGSRALAEAEDDAAKAKLAQLEAEKKRQSEGHAQSRARVAQLERENDELRSQVDRLTLRLQHMQRTGVLIRTSEVTE